MRSVLIALGLATAIATGWFASSLAQTEQVYSGPRSITFDVNGAMALTRSGSIDLITGTANVSGPCTPMRRCSPSDQRRLTISPSDLAKLRSLAAEVRTEGLFDTACLDRQRKESELDDLRQKQQAEEKQAEWKKQHPGFKGNAPNFVMVMPPPLDPFISSFQIEGVGTVVATPDYGSHKSDARCVTSATQTLWNMAIGF